MVPAFDIRDAAGLPLYLPLGFLCGATAVAFRASSSALGNAFNALEKGVGSWGGVPREWHAPLGGLIFGFIALYFPEVSSFHFCMGNLFDVVLPLFTGDVPRVRQRELNLERGRQRVQTAVPARIVTGTGAGEDRVDESVQAERFGGRGVRAQSVHGRRVGVSFSLYFRISSFYLSLYGQFD